MQWSPKKNSKECVLVKSTGETTWKCSYKIGSNVIDDQISKQLVFVDQKINKRSLEYYTIKVAQGDEHQVSMKIGNIQSVRIDGDGRCMYASIKHQLDPSIRANSRAHKKEADALRKEVVDYIRNLNESDVIDPIMESALKNHDFELAQEKVYWLFKSFYNVA